MAGGVDYEVLRHARVPGDDAVAFVAIARWNHGSGPEWCVEYWEEFGEAGPDRCFPSEAEAMQHATREFDLAADDWRPGPNQFGPRGDRPSTY